MPHNVFINLHTLRTCPFDYQVPWKHLIVRLILVSVYLCTHHALDKSFEIQRDDQEDCKFILQTNYFCCHFESEYTNTQRANVRRWILSVAQNYAMEWCYRFFKILFECFLQVWNIARYFYLSRFRRVLHSTLNRPFLDVRLQKALVRACVLMGPTSLVF